ncbi:MAG: ATP-binding protein [Campylobacterales bacterium]|nr:ATP-binding protein [Campylobacterales bacterium]
MGNKINSLIDVQSAFILAKDKILWDWIAYDSPKQILLQHEIEPEEFITKYAEGVFEYFMGVIAGEVEIGDCPVMQSFLTYLKDKDISADELFEICSHFRRAMINFSYDAGLNSRNISDEISYVFDKNFRGILKFYTDTIFQKLIDAKLEALNASRAKEYFLSNMSHEIRTPLNAILGFVNLLIDDDISKKHRKYLDIIQNSGENLLSIINDILDFSKLRSGEFTIEPKIFSLHDEISHTMELFIASATSKDITIASFIDPEIPKELYGDSLRIKQILSNFLSNAIKFTKSGGVISVDASCENKLLKISVEDNGIGIEKQDIKKIFTAFVQAQHCEQSNCSGTGLGLSICNQLALHMGGRVNVESTLGKGSLFWMEIPIEIHSNECHIFENLKEFLNLKIGLYSKNRESIFQYESLLKYANAFGMDMEIVDTLEGDFDIFVFVHEEINFKLKNTVINSDKKYIALMSKHYDDYEINEHIASMCFPLYCSKIYSTINELLHKSADKTVYAQSSHLFDGHILIAEDNEANQELMKIILTKYGLSFDIANNGLEALNLYKQNRYDLILMDEQMPLMNGIEALKEIIRYENKIRIRHTPISALTANVIKGARERGLLSGFDAFLGKPIILKELERVFLTYLTVNKSNKIEHKQESRLNETIMGLDVKKLKDTLLLNDDELRLLIEMFIKKMKKSLPDLEDAIQQRDYKKIALIAHSIKGSSANFRLEELQNSAAEMEKMARDKSSEYHYETVFEIINQIVQAIKIS